MKDVTESLSEEYGAFFSLGQKLRRDAGESEVGRLRRDRIPEKLWPLIPYAEFWGIPDDGFREELVEQAPPEILRGLREAVSKHIASLLEWLAGHEAAKATPSNEYVAFSAMLMAYDYPRHAD